VQTQLLLAVAALHEKFIFHGDIKPANLLWLLGAGHNGLDKAILTDLGGARVADNNGDVPEYT
jgi:serine/threonine protein kinase